MLLEAMLAEEVGLGRVPAFINDDDWYVEQKLDGHRILACVENREVLYLNRNGATYSKGVPAPITTALSTLAGSWIFDGELVNGTYWVFDMLHAEGTPLLNLPYRQRRYALEQLVGERFGTHVRFIPCAQDSRTKGMMVQQLLGVGAEGVILKHKDGIYRPGRRSDRMLKAKFVKTLDAVVLETWREGKASMSLGLVQGGKALVEVGAVNMQGKPLNDIKPGDVAEIRYLYATDDNRLYQPAFMRIRHDKPPLDCTMDQLQYTDKEVIDFAGLSRG